MKPVNLLQIFRHTLLGYSFDADFGPWSPRLNKPGISLLLLLYWFVIVIACQRQQNLRRLQAMVKLRQTLLPFTSKPSQDELPKPPDQSHHQNSISPKPPPQLPTEVWDHILDPLGTIALKKFRLVCLEWSAIGA